jgi:CheY-like chemotaxis protein
LGTAPTTWSTISPSLCDIALCAVLNQGRFDLGFYAGRIFGLMAASFILGVLLLENGMLYARLVEVSRELDRHNRSLEQIVAERTQRLLQSEKVATMGSLLAGVSHELNNPLSIVMAYAHLLKEYSGADPVKAQAQKINAAAEHCARIVKNFLALARQRPPERGDVHLNAVIREVLEMLAYELRTDSVEVTTEWPVSARPRSVTETQAVEPLAAIPSKRLLVVDAEVEIANVLSDILTQAGHHADTANDGAAALDLLGRHAYDLILTDTKMPGMDGPAFYGELKRRFPSMSERLIFLTGDLLSRDKREFLEATGAPALAKPFDVQEVRRHVHRMLTTPSGGAVPGRRPASR